MNADELAAITVDCALELHKAWGPGMLESAYEAVLAHLLRARGLTVERQVLLPIHYKGLVVEDGFRIDLLVEGKLLIELKASERLLPVHGRQVLTYLKFMNLSLGLLINFGAPTLKEGLRRIANFHPET